MFALISPEKIQLPPGSVVRLPATWQNYQDLCQQRGDGSIPRMKYKDGELYLMSPLPRHGRDAHLLANIVTTLLDHNQQEYEAFTPITMELLEESGIEPDYCFYVDNWEAASGKYRIDWKTEPPPDLVIEIDVTSYTSADDYLPYQVPEVWLLKREQLAIYGFESGRYVHQSHSRYFPGLDLQAIVTESFQIAFDRNTSTAIRKLRQQLQAQQAQ
jgi:Uma2 family endonuclease